GPGMKLRFSTSATRVSSFFSPPFFIFPPPFLSSDFIRRFSPFLCFFSLFSLCSSLLPTPLLFSHPAILFSFYLVFPFFFLFFRFPIGFGIRPFTYRFH